jgi:hypothetical protein
MTSEMRVACAPLFVREEIDFSCCVESPSFGSHATAQRPPADGVENDSEIKCAAAKAPNLSCFLAFFSHGPVVMPFIKLLN